MNTDPTVTREHGQLSALVALGFYMIGLACLVTASGILLGFPEVLRGDPYRIEVIALAALAIPGFVGSFVFGTFYAVAALLSSTGLWSRPLALIHLALHALGMGWMVAAFGGMPFFERPFLGIVIGAMIVLAGVFALIANITLTTGQRNRWEPAQLSVVTALFWLGVTAALAVGLVIEPFRPVLRMDAVRLIEAHAQLALGGFLWLGLLGTSLKLLSMFVVSNRGPGGFSWAGLVIINCALLGMIPVLLFYPGAHAASVLAAIILGGSLLYFADMARLFAGTRKRPDAGLLAGLLGIATGIAVLAWMVAGMPVWAPEGTSLAVRELARIQFSIAVFGTFTLVFLGMGMRVVPFLVWRLRCAPLVSKRPTPSGADLSNPAGRGPALLCLAAAFAYLAAGQLTNNPAGVQIAVLCLLVGTGWFVYTLSPAIRAFFFGLDPIVTAEQAKTTADIKRIAS